MRHVSPDGLDEVWDEIAPSLELNVDLAESIPRANPSTHKSVVDHKDPNQRGAEQDCTGDDRVRHAERIRCHYPRAEMTEESIDPTVPKHLLDSLARLGFGEPTEIQAFMRDPIMRGQDVLALAPTGTGKTLGFGIPVMARLLNNPPKGKRGAGGARYVDTFDRLRAIVVSPTRELAQQVASDLSVVAKGTLLRIGAVFGKSPTAPQREMVRTGPDILVGTPGRLREFFDEGVVSFAAVQTFVIDEADRMADMGFLPQIELILSSIPAKRQVICLSATLPASIESRVLALLRNPVKAEVGVRNSPINRKNARCDVVDSDKVSLLLALMREKHLRGVVVYVRTRRRAGWVAEALRRSGITVGLLHGDRSQRSRNEALAAFADGKAECLVATDVAARGLHVPRIRTVVNYDVPLMPEDFVHRVGRAGHGGGAAESFSFVDPLEQTAWSRVVELVGEEIKSMALPTFASSVARKFARKPDHSKRPVRDGVSGAVAVGATPTKAKYKFKPEIVATKKNRKKKLFPVAGKESISSKVRMKRVRSAPISRDAHRGGGIRRTRPDPSK